MAQHGHSLDIVQARRSFFDGQLPPGLVPQPLLRSWERTFATGLRPADRMLFGQAVSRAEARRVGEEHRSFVDLATPDILNLWQSMQSPAWVVLLTNADGTIVHSVGNHDLAPRELRLPLQCGRRLPECELGTNAPAVVLSEGEASVVLGGEHFLDELSHFSCVAAPVFGIDGALVGVLDATGFDAMLDPRALQRVNLAARSIENRLFADCKDGLLVGLHEDPRMLGTPLQGLLRLRDDGRVLGANRCARQMLGLDRTVMANGLGPTVDELLQQPFQRHSGSTTVQAVRTRTGAMLYLSVLQSPPSGAAQTKQVVTSPAARPQDPADTLLSRASRVLQRRIPVLLQGETGTGKEWFARRLHEATRPGKPFVAINCSAIAESLVEAELFGYEDGAYTGSRKGGAAGKIEQANGGTLFLDEIGDMPLHLQTRLLRSLQERSNVRLGGSKEIRVDIQVVSATHRDLAGMIATGAFREDLYYRLSGFRVELPPLRERGDLQQMIHAVLAEVQEGQQPCHLPEDVEALLLGYRWPGNIRQLRHVIEVACALSEPCGEIRLENLPDDISRPRAPVDCLPEAVSPASGTSLSHLKEEWVASSLAAHNGNVSAAAKALGVSRSTLYRNLQRLSKS
ncbi:sigma-54-dependent Fis family transcriptional regulator [Pseudomonas sp. Marseille-P9899]|uniref:sigma-54-dependent Fis family transcriptional regulator n=1 Tax=Pseudomonas sp. Marseille-P9899 TaxID=2730401 RepID=UPI0015887503|nr:sigma-54-dependent Fis family transcriptional regulator [Pseudomonas sp. Marseille-P9899]